VLPVPRGAQVLGAKRKTLAGFSSSSVQPHQGFIYSSPVIQVGDSANSRGTHDCCVSPRA
jgi:RNA processing factor Prp31